MLQYEDEDHDFVILASDGDLAAAVDHAKATGLKVMDTNEVERWSFLLKTSFYHCPCFFSQGLRLHLDYSGSRGRRKASAAGKLEYAQADAWEAAYSTVAAGAALVAGLGVLAYLRRGS